MLSAQATDVSVNLATRDLFGRVRTPAAMVALGEEALREQIKTIGLFNTKAKNVIALVEALIRDHGSEVPRTREELEKLPGVGRKTANVVLNTAFGEETFAVDTHIFRVGNRTGLAPGKNPLEVELKLDKVTPQPFRRDAHHWLILHGRYTCKARTAAMLEMPGDRPVPLQAQDAAAEGLSASAARTGCLGSSEAHIATGPTASTRSADRSRSRPNRLP